MLSTRMTIIIRELMKADTPVTSEYLAKVLDVTSRTIRNDVRELESIVTDFGAEVKSIRGTGYKLLVHDDTLYRQFLQEAATQDDEKPGEIPNLPEERICYVIKRLLLAEGYIKLETIAEELFISKSTLQNDFKDVKNIIRRYGVTLESRPNFGLKVKGEEFKLRLCIADHIFKNIEKDLNIENNNVPVFIKEDLKTIRKIILEHIHFHQIALSDIGLNNLVIHIAIASNRIKNEKYVTMVTNELADLKRHKQYRVAQEIVKDLESESGNSFPETEIAYITIHLLGTKMVTELHFDNNNFQNIMDRQIYDTVKKIIDTVDQELQLNIKDDQELFMAMCLHLRPAVHRYHFGIDLPNPLLDDIKSKYPVAFQAAVIAGIVLKRELNIEINENEMGYLALHLGAAVENQKIDIQPKKCMIVCASGVGSARLLASKIQARFGSKIEIVGISDFYKISQIPMNSLDIIVSTIPIPMGLPVPVIQVNTILGDGDLDKIETSIMKRTTQKLKYLKEDLVFLQKDFESREDVLRFLGEKLQSMGLVTDKYLDSVFEREALSPTSYGNFVAVPHPVTPKTGATFWTICTLKNPIDWGGKRVQFVCLLNVEKSGTTDLQCMYDLLVQIIDDSQVVQKLIKCKTFKEIMAVFQHAY